MGPTERELFTVITGHGRVHDSSGGFETVGPGEGLYIPPGFEGSFEVRQALTKIYMICEWRRADKKPARACARRGPSPRLLLFSGAVQPAWQTR
jgi:hypothetical protein